MMLNTVPQVRNPTNSISGAVLLLLHVLHCNGAGFTAVFDAMRQSGKPAVGHNPAMDLAYSLHAFAGQLPAGWPEFKDFAASWFPGGVYDTKRLAAQLPEVAA